MSQFPHKNLLLEQLSKDFIVLRGLKNFVSEFASSIDKAFTMRCLNESIVSFNHKIHSCICNLTNDVCIFSNILMLSPE